MMIELVDGREFRTFGRYDEGWEGTYATCCLTGETKRLTFGTFLVLSVDRRRAIAAAFGLRTFHRCE